MADRERYAQLARNMFERRIVVACLSLLTAALVLCIGSVALRAARNRAVVQSLLICDDASVYSRYGDYSYVPPPVTGGLVLRGGQRIEGFRVFGEPSDLQQPLVAIFGDHAFTNISEVYWENEAVNDKRLALLARVPNLRELHLDHANITDAGIPRIVKLHKLQVLELSSTHITESGIRQLAACSNLRELDLSDTPVDDALAAELQKALPTCLIFR